MTATASVKILKSNRVFAFGQLAFCPFPRRFEHLRGVNVFGILCPAHEHRCAGQAGQPALVAHDVGGAHQMVVDGMREMVSGMPFDFNMTWSISSGHRLCLDEVGEFKALPSTPSDRRRSTNGVPSPAPLLSAMASRHFAHCRSSRVSFCAVCSSRMRSSSSCAKARICLALALPLRMSDISRRCDCL